MTIHIQALYQLELHAYVADNSNNTIKTSFEVDL